jgi:multisubunit Na+/H+ antiporter MnhB subunit
MKSFLLACVVAIVVAVVGGAVLWNVNPTAEHTFTDQASVRLGA